MKKLSDRNAGCSECRLAHGRRAALRTVLGLGLSVPFLQVASGADKNPATQRPAAGDQFVFTMGDKAGQVIKVDDLPLGGPQELAYPMDPASKVVRDATRLNQVLLIRLDPAKLKPDTKRYAADGVVAYSSICTHQGCDVSQWKADLHMLLCVCHGSEFDPTDRAKVTFGPAPRRLPVLPVKVQGGIVVVAAPFIGKPGFMDL